MANCQKILAISHEKEIPKKSSRTRTHIAEILGFFEKMYDYAYILQFCDSNAMLHQLIEPEFHKLFEFGIQSLAR